MSLEKVLSSRNGSFTVFLYHANEKSDCVFYKCYWMLVWEFLTLLSLTFLDILDLNSSIFFFSLNYEQNIIILKV